MKTASCRACHSCSILLTSKRVDVVSVGIFQPIFPLTLMCDAVNLDASNPLLAAVVGPVAFILNIDPAPLGLTQPRPTRPQLTTMVMCALECAQDSDAFCSSCRPCARALQPCSW
jgi:hypothetical protein